MMTMAHSVGSVGHARMNETATSAVLFRRIEMAQLLQLLQQWIQGWLTALVSAATAWFNGLFGA